jgi:hypothetical protein
MLPMRVGAAWCSSCLSRFPASTAVLSAAHLKSYGRAGEAFGDVVCECRTFTLFLG